MRADLRALIDTKPFYQDGLREIAALLPESDAELAGLLTTAIDGNAADDFIFLIFAAAMNGRKLNADLLHGGATLLPDDWRFAWDTLGLMMQLGVFPAKAMTSKSPNHAT
jgi:hypothetical protein